MHDEMQAPAAAKRRDEEKARPDCNPNSPSIVTVINALCEDCGTLNPCH
jgi:hypothetical protein